MSRTCLIAKWKYLPSFQYWTCGYRGMSL